MMSVFTYKAADKEFLVGAGLLPLNLTRNDWPARPLKVIQGTDIDFMDVHLYDVHGTMEPQLVSSEYYSWPTNRVPWICGEFGAHKSLYGSASAAAQPMQNWRNQMKYSYGFKGALFWVLDSDWVRNDGWWNLTDENGIINNYLSPNGLGWDY
jgi:endo-1,4-beta-mannosidase